MSSESCQPPKNRVESRSSISHQIPPPVWDRPAWPPRPPVRLPTQPTARRELTHTPSFTHPARSAINRRTASAFSASDNGNEAIITSAAENESATIGSESTRLETEPPIASPCSFSGELLPPELPRRERRFVSRCFGERCVTVLNDSESLSPGSNPGRAILQRSLSTTDNERFALTATAVTASGFARPDLAEMAIIMTGVDSIFLEKSAGTATGTATAECSKVFVL